MAKPPSVVDSAKEHVRTIPLSDRYRILGVTTSFLESRAVADEGSKNGAMGVIEMAS